MRLTEFTLKANMLLLSYVSLFVVYSRLQRSRVLLIIPVNPPPICCVNCCSSTSLHPSFWADHWFLWYLFERTY